MRFQSVVQRGQKLCHTRLVKNRRPTIACYVRNVDMPEALLFDCDGVLVDTERDGHRVAFNTAFSQKGLPHEWDVSTYGKLLSIGGGKERMTAYFTEHMDQEPFRSITDPEERKDFVKGLHELKTGIFQGMIENGQMPLRSGVRRMVEEAITGGVKVAVCSTSNEKAVQTIVDVLLGSDISNVMKVFAGDIVENKKPDPEIYTLAATALGVDAARCVVIEDSHIGMCAAKAAGMRCIVTTSGYTADEDFSIADAVFDCLGDDSGENVTLLDLTTPGKPDLA